MSYDPKQAERVLRALHLIEFDGRNAMDILRESDREYLAQLQREAEDMQPRYWCYSMASGLETLAGMFVVMGGFSDSLLSKVVLGVSAVTSLIANGLYCTKSATSNSSREALRQIDDSVHAHIAGFAEFNGHLS